MAYVKSIGGDKYQVIHLDKVIEETHNIERARHICIGINLALEQVLKPEPQKQSRKLFVAIMPLEQTLRPAYCFSTLDEATRLFIYDYVKPIAIKAVEIEFAEGEGL